MKTKKVSIISRESDEMTLDIRLLSEELRQRGFDVCVLTRLLRKQLSLSQITYIGHLLKQIHALNTSDVVVLDTYCIPVSMLPHRKKVKVIQMWHALSAIKKFGWQTVGMRDGSSAKVAKLMRMHAGYDRVICCSDVTKKYFCEAFRVSAEKIVKLGLPRIDYILKRDKDMEDRIKDCYPELKNGRKNVLYAPTFHKGEPVDVKGLADALDMEKYNLIVKLHPIDTASSEHVERSGVIYDDRFDSYDLLRVADIVVSDYSSFVVEASLSRRPLYLYIYDESSYEKTTGLNMDFDDEAIGRYAFRSAGELATALEKEYDMEALNEFRRKYIDIDTENCTAKLADYIESLMK